MPVQNLATIRALGSVESNMSGQVKSVKDSNDKFIQGLSGSSQTISNLARTGVSSLQKNTQEIGKVWGGVRQHIATAAAGIAGSLAAFSTSAKALGSPVTAYTPASMAAVVRDSQSNPYTTLINAGNRIVQAGIKEEQVNTSNDSKTETKTTYNATVIGIGLGVEVLVFTYTLYALGEISKKESESYEKQAAAGRAAIGSLARLINRATDPGRAGGKDFNVFDRPGSAGTQYDGDPAINTGGSGIDPIYVYTHGSGSGDPPYDSSWYQN